MIGNGKPLFGKAEWFKMVNGGFGIHPTTVRGWIFSALWGGAIVLPSLGLLGASKNLEALIWVGFASFLLLRETRSLLAEKRRENVFVIGEDTDVTKVTTNNFDLELRQ